MNFEKLSLNEKFGQMIMLGLDVYDINDEIIEIIKTYKIGGVVLYKNNYTSIETMIDFINKLKEINKNNKIPLFVAIDQENGLVNRFPKDILRMPGARKQTLGKNQKVNNAINDITTYILKSVGVNMNFAPVIDLKCDNDINNKRSYGSYDEVLKNGLPFMKTMQNEQIISVVKHFPGHGATKKDSHFILPKIKDVKSLEDRDLKLFKEFIKEGADSLMVGHLKIKGMGKKPATINSKIIAKYLSDFKGLIITDDLRMNYLRYLYGTKKCIKESINAGCDICMIKYKRNDSKMFNKLLGMVKYCEIDPEKINNSAKKIVNFKSKYAISNELNKVNLDVELINKKIRQINDIINKEVEEII